MVKIAIVGASGFIGQHLASYLTQKGHQISRIGRKKSDLTDKAWQPGLEFPAQPDVVINLAGANIAEKAWTTSRKQELISSRVNFTQDLCESLTNLSAPPKLLISTSGTGFYGNRGNERLTESSPPGKGFLADLSVAWEAATKEAEGHGIHVIHPRFGVVLSYDGGALKKMLPIFKYGLGGVMGSGKQFMPWIHIDDLLRAMRFFIEHPLLSGTFNIVAPEPLTNRDFTHALAKSLHRPAFLRIPAAAIRLALGEMGEETLLYSCKVEPARLLQEGFTFRYPTILEALKSFPL